DTDPGATRPRTTGPGTTAPGTGDRGAGCAPAPEPDAAAGWFGAEHANLLAAQQVAHGHGWDVQVRDLAWALDPYHRHRGHLEEAAAAWRLAVDAAGRLPGPAARAQAHQMLGDACAQLGRTDDALRHLGRALELAEPAGDAACRGEIHHSLGGAWERHGDDRRALEHARQALLAFEGLDDTYRQARALNGVGWLESRLGRHVEARAHCEAALALMRGHPADRRRFGEANILDSLGYVAHRLHDHGLALDCYLRALAICRAHGHAHLEADVLDHLAWTHLARRHPAQARAAWRLAHALFTAQHRLAAAELVRQQLDGLARPRTG
ncbi:MAG: tetratricopeptide repeat protein, partial [Streptomyces sp.]|nr:tetratricopeptide repeat protein [Streptomyces sp.]